MNLFERNDVERLIKLLALKLDEAGVVGTVSMVGGAAISLQYVHDRDSTTDIDALFPQSQAVRSVIEEISKSENLQKDWINDAVKAYVPFEVSNMWLDLFSIGEVTVRVASAELLLAMKLRADRGLRDRDDIYNLLVICGCRSILEVEEIYEKFHHQEVMDGRTRQVVQEMMATLRREDK